MEVVKDRYQPDSNVVTSLLSIDIWHNVIDEPTFANAILDRLIQNAHQLPLDSQSLRKTRGVNTEKENE